MKSWVKYLLWIIGLIILVYAFHYLDSVAYQKSEATFKVLPEAWVHILIVFAFGVYLSLILIGRTFQLNLPMLIFIFLPSFILAFDFPFAISFHLPIQFKFHLYDTHGIYLIVSGFSLMLSLFKTNK